MTKLDIKRIAKALGAEKIIPFPVTEGFFGAMKAAEDFKQMQNDEHCLVEAFFREQEKLPRAQRKNYCHLYCPCSRCNPASL